MHSSSWGSHLIESHQFAWRTIASDLFIPFSPSIPDLDQVKMSISETNAQVGLALVRTWANPDFSSIEPAQSVFGRRLAGTRELGSLV